PMPQLPPPRKRESSCACSSLFTLSSSRSGSATPRAINPFVTLVCYFLTTSSRRFGDFYVTTLRTRSPASRRLITGLEPGPFGTPARHRCRSQWRSCPQCQCNGDEPWPGLVNLPQDRRERFCHSPVSTSW